jgi:hypothetical protein
MSKPTRRGGPRPGSGRPPIAEETRTLAVTMPAEMWSWCKHMGDGNASAYVRRLIDWHMASEQERIQRLLAERERMSPEVRAWIEAGEEASE